MTHSYIQNPHRRWVFCLGRCCVRDFVVPDTLFLALLCKWDMTHIWESFRILYESCVMSGLAYMRHFVAPDTIFLALLYRWDTTCISEKYNSCVVVREMAWRLQHTATHCNTLQHTATHCNTLQHTATHCNTLQHTATHCNTLSISRWEAGTLLTLQYTATHCNTLQHTATHCNTLDVVVLDTLFVAL